jgi:hypothetical protein
MASTTVPRSPRGVAQYAASWDVRIPRNLTKGVVRSADVGILGEWEAMRKIARWEQKTPIELADFTRESRAGNTVSALASAAIDWQISQIGLLSKPRPHIGKLAWVVRQKGDWARLGVDVEPRHWCRWVDYFFPAPY